MNRITGDLLSRSSNFAYCLSVLPGCSLRRNLSPLYGCRTSVVCRPRRPVLLCCWALESFPPLARRSACWRRTSTSFCVGTCFRFSQAQTQEWHCWHAGGCCTHRRSRRFSLAAAPCPVPTSTAPGFLYLHTNSLAFDVSIFYVRAMLAGVKWFAFLSGSLRPASSCAC